MVGSRGRASCLPRDGSHFQAAADENDCARNCAHGGLETAQTSPLERQGDKKLPRNHAELRGSLIAWAGLTVQCANQAAPRARLGNQLLGASKCTTGPRAVPENMPVSHHAFRSPLAKKTLSVNSDSPRASGPSDQAARVAVCRRSPRRDIGARDMPASRKRASGVHVSLPHAGQVRAPISKHSSQSRQKATRVSGICNCGQGFPISRLIESSFCAYAPPGRRRCNGRAKLPYGFRSVGREAR